jgi:hypothetical protein
VPYTTTVTALDTEGGESVTIPVTARLWMLWTVVGTGSGPEHLQDEQGSQELQMSISLGNPATIAFQKDANFSSVSRMAGLSVQDTNRVGQNMGWLFRSGPFLENVSTDPIEIVAGRIDVPAADLPSMLPPIPMTIDAGTTLTALTATLAQGGIDFSATGTTTKTGETVGFSYTGLITLDPSADVAAAEFEALSVGISNPMLVFLPGPSIVSAIHAEILNLLRVFLVREVGPQIRRNLEQRINASVIASAGRSLPGGVLPAGISVSVRTISVTPARIQVRAALGAFGGVFSKLPPPSSGGGGTRICPVLTLATLGHSLVGTAVLREVRDARLATTTTGRRLIESYYRFGEEVSDLLRADSGLARRAARVAAELTSVLRAGAAVPEGLRVRSESLLRDLALAGSPDLRASVAFALEAQPWRLLKDRPTEG